MELYYYIGGILIVGFLFLVLIRFRRRRFSAEDQAFFAENWERVSNMEPRHAVLEADKLIDKALSALGYRGGFGDKLKKAKMLFSDYSGVWYAHKMRNKIAHEVEFHITDHEALRALALFKRALQDLGILIA